IFVMCGPCVGGIFGGAGIVSKCDIPGGAFIVVILMFAMPCVEALLLGRCSFTADDNKLIFRIGPIKYEYSYSKIKSAEVQTGFTHSRYGNSAHVELIITFTDGETETFCDSNVPDDALSTPEKHKEFHDNHQFTKLSNYINERAGRPDSNA
ncbi:MAG: hypothetical protein K2N71_07500, partial [Oscillospiraceae bacterium]|nr:hypothetical protein [Oscillospiraceae bacterium]